jgi:DNA-binding response OmpR family regulator
MTIGPGPMTEPMSACSVLVVEDDPGARKYISLTLQKAGYQVREAESGEEALELFDRQTPRVALLDLGLPGMDGFELCSEMRQRSEDMAILILTGRSDDSDKVSGLDLGADDFLVKPFGPDVLLARINAVLRRCSRQHLLADVLTLHDLRLEFHTLKVFKGDKEVDLTKREFALLAAFLKHPGELLTREQLQRAVWGENHFGSAKALDVIVCKLREKLEDNPAHPKYFKNEWGVGFVCG